jgi:hypothetical protein
MRAWHFVGDTLRDGRPVPKDGVKLIHTGDVIPCQKGLHASAHPMDALTYAPGNTLCLVECGGQIIEHGNPVDKIACSERTIIARMDAEPLLRDFARHCALSVVHLWEPPQVVCDYLMGDDAARAAAWDAARAAAWAAAWDAAWDAARAAARDAAWDAAWAAARAAAWAAARTAAWDAAGDAAWDAAWDAARAAAGDAAWAAARGRHRAKFDEMVLNAFEDWL